MGLPLNFIFKLSILLHLIYLDLYYAQQQQIIQQSVILSPPPPTSLHSCKPGSIIWKGICLNASYITNSDISIAGICAMYPMYCRKKLNYYFECPVGLQNSLLLDGMCVDGIIAQCLEGIQRTSGGLCSNGPIRRTFLYTLDMNRINFPTEQEYRAMKGGLGRKRRSKKIIPATNQRFFQSAPPQQIIVSPPNNYNNLPASIIPIMPSNNFDDSESKFNFIHNFHYFKYMYPGMTKIRVQIVLSQADSIKSINMYSDPLTDWLGISSGYYSPRQTGNINPNPTFVQDQNVFWEISNIPDPMIDPELPLAEHRNVDQPMIIPF